MSLCAWRPRPELSRGESSQNHCGHPQSPSPLTACSLAAVSSAPRRMCVMRIVVRCACAALSFPGRVVWICLLLDTCYLACVYDAAPLPPSSPADVASDAVVNNTSSDASGSSRSTSLLSLASHLAAPSAALSPSSLSLSSSSSKSLAESQREGNIGWNETSASLNSAGDPPGNTSSSISSRDDAAALTPHHPHDEDRKEKEEEEKEGGKGSGGRPPEQAVSSPRAGPPSRKEFPLALVVASATAAVSILLFFCLSYLWHTRQLDRRAQKLAIRLAAEVNTDLKCSQCRPQAPFRPGSSQDDDSASDSGGEGEGDSRVWRVPTTSVLDELNSLNEEEDEEVAEDGSRRKPGGVGRTLGTKKGWSGHSSGHTRSSLVTDQEILTHFASRRHSTFFI
ncbi:uncharacterized protein LOC143283841 [Babylonia areolata]|uniref:uncharacterized protein LOC143283841 n=1 Tax=Babylonia areolata TaxID=304850 RepID=UPI003FD68DDB